MEQIADHVSSAEEIVALIGGTAALQFTMMPKPCTLTNLWRRRPISSRCAYLLFAVICAACSTHETTVEFYVVDGYQFSQAERDAIQSISDSTAIEVRRLLPALPRELILRVQAGTDVIPETGETGSAISPNAALEMSHGAVHWIVDPNHEGGVAAIVRKELRGTLFHELHHMVRGMAINTIYSRDLMDRVIEEGMATVFERDYAQTRPPWGVYPDEVTTWVSELMALPFNAPREQWFSRHPDRRRWIGYKAGTYLVDRAMSSSGKSSAELVATSTKDVIEMALGR